MSPVGKLVEALRTGSWAVPAACVLVALALAVGLVDVDRRLGDDLGRVTFGAGPDGAREVLSAITTSMITFTGLVFSITIVVLQLTSSQFSPRVLRTFLRDRQTQLSLGAFVAYIHHVATAIQVSSIIRAVGDETRGVLARRFAVDAPPPAGRPAVPAAAGAGVTSPTHGLVRTVNIGALVRAARDADVLLVLPHPLGGFVPQDALLLEVHGDGQVDEGAVTRAVRLGKDRTMEQDVAFGLRQLVDIAERALSPGINDPTTAVQALDELHDVLRRLASRHLPDGVHRDEDGAVRLLTPPSRFADHLSLALDEIEQYGADATPVQTRVDDLLDDLLVAALPEHRPVVLARQRRRASEAGQSRSA